MARSGKRSPSKLTTAELLRRLASDPWRKVAAIILASLLWVFLDSQITKTVPLVCQLKIVDSFSGRAIDEVPDGVSVLEVQMDTDNFTPGAFRGPDDEIITEVTLSFTGPDHLVSSIQSGESFFVRTQARPGDTFLEFDVQRIQGNLELMRTLQNIQPSRIKLDLATNASTELPLTHELVRVDLPETDGQLYAQRLELQSMAFTPNTITLRGTVSNLEQIQKLVRAGKERLFDLDLRDRKDDFDHEEIRGQLILREIAKNLDVTCDPGSPTVRVPLRPDWEEFTLLVPVLLDTRGTPYSEDRFEPFTKLEVTLSATGSLANELRAQISSLDAWAAEKLRVIASLPSDYRAEEPINITGRLYFSKDPSLEKGRDYESRTTLLVIVQPR